MAVKASCHIRAGDSSVPAEKTARDPMIDCKHAFHDLLPRAMEPLRRRALKLTGNEHRAQDLVQATLLKAWASRDSYRPETNLQAWLFTIMRNTFFSDLRKMRREIEDVDGLHAQAMAESPRQVDAIALGELMAAIGHLPGTQRRPLVLVGVFGFSQLEAADACGCSIGTIKSRVSRSRAALSFVLAHDRPGGGTGTGHAVRVPRKPRHDSARALESPVRVLDMGRV